MINNITKTDAKTGEAVTATRPIREVLDAFWSRRMQCGGCQWNGKRSECGSDELCDGIIDTCPQCGADCEPAS